MLSWLEPHHGDGYVSPCDVSHDPPIITLAPANKRAFSAACCERSCDILLWLSLICELYAACCPWLYVSSWSCCDLAPASSDCCFCWSCSKPSTSFFCTSSLRCKS